MSTRMFRFLAAVALTAVVATACGGGGDTSLSSPSDSTDSTSESGSSTDTDDAAPVQSSGPIDGLVLVRPSFDFGLYSVDRVSGEVAALGAPGGIESVDPNRRVYSAGGSVFLLSLTTREGQDYSYDVSLIKADVGTGEVSELVPLGFTQETDDSEDRFNQNIHAITSDSVIVRSGLSGEGASKYHVYDSATGAEKGSFDEPFYEFEGDEATCSGGADNYLGLSDGRLAAFVLGSVAIIDTSTGDIELMRQCGEESSELDAFVSAAEFDEYAVLNDGDAPTPEEIELLLRVGLSPSGNVVEGGGDLWWLAIGSRSTNEVRAIAGGIVQFDLATESIEAVHPLGGHVGSYLDCVDGGDVCDTENLSNGQLQYVDDQLVIVDPSDNGQVLVFDPASGAISATEIPKGEGVDYTSTQLYYGDPGAVWLDVGRFTITEETDSGRTASGPEYVELFDPATGTIDISIPVEEFP